VETDLDLSEEGSQLNKYLPFKSEDMNDKIIPTYGM
jgi:hypothetical protein